MYENNRGRREVLKKIDECKIVRMRFEKKLSIGGNVSN